MRYMQILAGPNAGRDSDLDALAAYIGTLAWAKPPHVPEALLAQVTQGKEIFFSRETGCAACHPPPYYTDSGRRTDDGRFVRHDVGTRAPGGSGSQELDTPSLLGVLRSEPYLHDGRAKTIEDIFTMWNPDDRHGRTSHLSKEQILSLAVFLRYLAASPAMDTTPAAQTSTR